jgi:hypothetical protein
MMKKKLMCAALAAVVAVGLFAQGTGSRKPVPEKVTVSGNLAFDNGSVILNAGADKYQVPGLLRYAGFIAGLEENAKVSLEGYDRVAGQGDKAVHVFITTRLEINGRSYDLGDGHPRLARAPVFRPGPEPDFRLKGRDFRLEERGRQDRKPGGPQDGPKQGGPQGGGQRQPGDKQGGPQKGAN